MVLCCFRQKSYPLLIDAHDLQRGQEAIGYQPAYDCLLEDNRRVVEVIQRRRKCILFGAIGLVLHFPQTKHLVREQIVSRSDVSKHDC